MCTVMSSFVELYYVSKGTAFSGENISQNNNGFFSLKLSLPSQWINDTSIYIHLLGF